MEGTRPMRVNPIPKTSKGVKLRLNSACVVGHMLCAGKRQGAGRPCLYPRLANRDSSRSSAVSVFKPAFEPRLDGTIGLCETILPGRVWAKRQNILIGSTCLNMDCQGAGTIRLIGQRLFVVYCNRE